MSHQDEPVLDPAQADAWTAQQPPDDFADRVMNAAMSAGGLPAAPPFPRRRIAMAAALGALTALAAVALLQVTPPAADQAARGTVAARGRMSVPLGHRAVAVAEDGAQVSYEVDADGAAQVTQTRGQVFYRVDHGEPFVVHTPAGSVEVLGTCFDVNVTQQEQNMDRSKVSAAAVAGVVGAALGAAVMVTVYEGRVALANGGGKVTVEAGQRGQANAHSAPRVVDGRRETALQRDNARLRQQRQQLQTQVDDQEAQIGRLLKAHSAGQPALAQEVVALRTELGRLRARQSALDEAERARSGNAIPFPPELPERYRQDALHREFNEALGAAKVPGEVKSLDCTEFPCMVFGEATLDGDKVDSQVAVKAFEDELARRYPRDAHSMHESMWTKGGKDSDGVERQHVYFGISVYPKDMVGEEQQDALRKRVRWRGQQYSDTLME